MDDTNLVQDLDRPFLEFLERGHVRALFQNIPAEELDDTIANLNFLFAERLRQVRNERYRRRQRWFWIGYVPIPVMFRVRNIQRFILNTFVTIVLGIFKITRILIFIIAILNYFDNFYRIFIIFGEAFTFSDNIFRDLLTFVFRNNVNLILQNKIIQVNRGIIYIDESQSQFKIFKSTIFNVLARNMKISCKNNLNVFATRYKCPDISHLDCHLTTDTLLFKFSDVLLDFFPMMTETGLTSVVVGIFLTYALLGDILCFNVLMFFFFNLLKKVFVYQEVYVASAKIIWKTFGSLIA